MKNGGYFAKAINGGKMVAKAIIIKMAAQMVAKAIKCLHSPGLAGGPPLKWLPGGGGKNMQVQTLSRTSPSK